MRLDTVKREVSSSGTMEVSKATIKATPKIFDMFANDTYANKPVAIMRELVANGVDAHVAAGRPDRSVEVILPTPLDPMCVIRDFGTGMPHEFVMTDFMSYTDGSTKDKNDDAIGGFGIGSKSPFAYVDQYTLRVVHEGILSVYTMFKDEDGIPAIGLQGQTTTDEPNGVEVSFPVEDSDMGDFREAAQQALQYFRPMPLVTNGELKAPEYTYVGNNWAMRPKAGELGVIMGGVRYPVAESSLSWELRGHKDLSPLIGYGIDITLPIGACGVAMSREQLSYVPKTSESIKAALEGILEDVVKTFSTFFDTCNSEWEAMLKLAEETGFESYNRSARAKLMLSNARYKGRELQTGFKLADNDLPLARGWMIPSKSNRRGSLCPTPKWGGLSDVFTVTPGRAENIIIDDLPDSPKSKAVAKIRAFVDTQPQAKDNLVFRPPQGKVKEMIALLRGCDTYILTSTLPEPPAIVRSNANGAARPRVRMFSFNGGNDRYTGRRITNLSPGMAKEVKEIKYADQPASGIMVVMNSFDLPPDFGKKMDTELIAYNDLSFINAVDESKLKATFRKFEDVWQERFDAKMKKWPNIGESLAVANDSTLSGFFDSWRLILSPHPTLKFTPTSAQASRPFGKLVALYNSHVRGLTDEQRKLAPFVASKLPRGVDPARMIKAFQSQTDAYILWEELRLNKRPHLDLFLRNI
jgi:hypothetical protein